MLRLAVIAAVGMLSAAGVAKAIMVDQTPAPTEASLLRGAQASDSPAAPSADAEVLKSADGHYWAEGQVDGTRVRFLVDTGATSVALTAEDAQRLGFDPSTLVYDVPVHTANGEGHAARIRLANLSVAGARVEDVDAMVVDHGLSTSLLGMSYLGRLQRFEATQQALILRP